MSTTTITTRFVHNDLSGPKVVAKGGGRQRTVPYDHSKSAGEMHHLAAQTLADVLGLTVPPPAGAFWFGPSRMRWEAS